MHPLFDPANPDVSVLTSLLEAQGRDPAIGMLGYRVRAGGGDHNHVSFNGWLPDLQLIVLSFWDLLLRPAEDWDPDGFFEVTPIPFPFS